MEKQNCQKNAQEKIEQMLSCEHIFIVSKIDKCNDGHRTDTYEYVTCLKCGLDSKFSSYDYLLDASFFQEKMGRIYDETKHKGITLSDCKCDSFLARGIYLKLKEVYPDASDELICHYFKCALHNIQTKETTENVQKSRTKRLYLTRGFKKWKSSSIISGD